MRLPFWLRMLSKCWPGGAALLEEEQEEKEDLLLPGCVRGRGFLAVNGGWSAVVLLRGKPAAGGKEARRMSEWSRPNPDVQSKAVVLVIAFSLCLVSGIGCRTLCSSEWDSGVDLW